MDSPTGQVPTAPPDPLIGTLVDGRYQVVARIARGGMATVYEAIDTRLDRTVALKMMSAALAEDPGFVTRFRREARMVVDWIADYWQSLSDRPVQSQVEPGWVRSRLPPAPPSAAHPHPPTPRPRNRPAAAEPGPPWTKSKPRFSPPLAPRR